MVHPGAEGAGSLTTHGELLCVEGLYVSFPTHMGTARAVEDVSFSVGPKEVVGLVGESGCGKTVTGLALMGLVPPPGRVSGRVLFLGRDLTTLSKEEMRRVRGASISMVFQEPMTALNPLFKVGTQVAEAAEVHLGVTGEEAWRMAVEMLKRVGMPAAERRAEEYPHQMSGGMRQRVMIAMALILNPELLIADEPTTGLDVTIQAQILDLLGEFKDRNNSLILITHDMSVVNETADRVVVMYAGRIMEQAPVAAIFKEPLHPYTRGLLASIPRLGEGKKELQGIPGTVPSPFEFPEGCRFRPRCSDAFEKCTEEPRMLTPSDGRGVRCWLFG